MTIVIMKKSTIAAGEFKAKCLALIDEVQASRVEYVITKRSKPVARLVPLEPAAEGGKRAFGCLKGTVEIVGDILSTGEHWEADG
jgi:prevent-host-death family protein